MVGSQDINMVVNKAVTQEEKKAKKKAYLARDTHSHTHATSSIQEYRILFKAQYMPFNAVLLYRPVVRPPPSYQQTQHLRQGLGSQHTLLPPYTNC